MHLKAIRLHNWMRFRGKHEILLHPKTYALVARSENDAERSNGLGKSSLLEAIRFVLSGKQNPNRHAGADGWISDGEKEGGVTIETSDGIIAERSRKKSTELVVHHNGSKSKGDEAQALLDSLTGLTDTDFIATSYFAQGQISRLILAKPEERTALVAAWFRLGPLEQAEDIVRKETATLAWEAQTLAQNIEQQRAIELQERGPNGELEAVKAQRDATQTMLNEAEGLEKLAQDELTRAYRAKDNGALIRLHASLSEQIKLEREQLLPEMEIDALQLDVAVCTTEGNDLRDRLAIASRALKQADQLQRGEFNGTCPVAGIACPAKVQINTQTATNKKRHDDIATAMRDDQEKLRVARDKQLVATTELEGHANAAKRLGDLRTNLSKIEPEYARVKALSGAQDEGAAQSKLMSAKQQVIDLKMKLATLDRSLTVAMQSRAEQARLSQNLAAVELRRETAREATVIFGKGGAQRRVAERNLAKIQERTNARLYTAGIDLTVEASWVREGKELASTCDACGAPFIASRKARKCEKCGAERGPHLVNKLDLILSDQSGGLEDLAGVGVQFAAAEWLREERGVRWATALIDEPFGQLDTAYRRAVAQGFSKMLSGYEQAIIVAHNTSMLDAMQGRIEIVSDGRSSRVQVIA